MVEWSIAHPWLAFWIIITAMLVVDNIVSNVCKIVFSIFCKDEKRTEDDTNG